MALAATFSFATCAYAQESVKNPYIEVSTRAEKQITPDIVYVGIKINEVDSKGKVKIEEKEKQMILMLQELKVNVAENLTVKDMSSDLKKYFLKKNGALSTKSYTLKLKNADEVMAVIDALNGIGISDIEIERTTVSPELEKEVKDELLATAAVKAKENAAILTETLGSKIGKVIYIQNYYNFTQPYGANFSMRSVKAMAMDAVMEESISIPSLEVSKVTLSINVTCRFAIE